MTLSKIQLSHAELDLICNAELILTKNKALEKVKALLEAAQLQMQEFVVRNEQQQESIFTNPPKISRGEQYLGLPWMILDYPRIFTSENSFAIRSMFWWGNFFSSTLHVSGNFALHVGLATAYHALKEHYICINPDPWQHHFGEENYRPVHELSEQQFKAALQATDHIKIAMKWPVADWKLMPDKLYGNWEKMLSFINYYPGGETGPSPDSPTALTDL